MNEFLLNIAKGIDWVAEKIGLADKVRSARIQEKSEKAEEKIIDPAFNFVGWLNQNWQLAIIGLVAILVLLRD